MSNKRVKTEEEKTVSRNRRIVAQFKSEHKMAHTGESGAVGNIYKRLARQWEMPIREIRTIVETADALAEGRDPEEYIAEQAKERAEKAEDFRRKAEEKSAADIWLNEYYAKQLAEAQNS